MSQNRICSLLNIELPIIQAGMVWCSGHKLASVVSNCGGLGLIGAGSMKPDTLASHLDKMKNETDKPWGVNVPVFSAYADDQMDLIIKSRASVVFTSAGSPKKYTQLLKDNNKKVVHVVPSPQLALKCQDAGVDAVVAEGFEAGGHNGLDETTTLVLIPEVVEAVDIPVIAAGGIATGSQMLAAISLGADAVQIGSRFAASKESSAHDNYKKAIIDSTSGSTKLVMKSVMPVRMLKNSFYQEIASLEQEGASKEELIAKLGKGRAKRGIFEGDLEEGELEVGQVSSSIKSILTVQEIFDSLINEYQAAKNKLPNLE